MQFNGQVALVTGASRGIGAAIAETLAQAGAKVIGTATTADGAAAIDARLAPLGGAGVAFNVTGGAEAVDALISDVETRFGPVAILVNNAGRTISTVDVADQAFNLLCTFIDVEFDALAAKRRQTLADGDGTGFRRGGTDHDGPFPGQRIGNGSTDAAGGTGNEDDFAW